MKLLTLIVLLTTTQLAHSLTKSEVGCLALNVYHEARGSKDDWLKVASVAINRSKSYKKYGSKSSNICDIVKSKQYTSARYFKNKIKEQEVFLEIRQLLEITRNYNQTEALFFSSKKGKMHYRKT